MMWLKRLKKFRFSLGPVEQAQIAISTAVVVSLATIVAVRATSGQKLEWLLFGSVLTVGLFGFIIVAITLKYGRILEEQKQELLALNTFAQAINRSVDIESLLANALREILRLLDIEYGWIYRLEGENLVRAAELRTNIRSAEIFGPLIARDDPRFQGLFSTVVTTFPRKKEEQQFWPYGHIRSWASVPIFSKGVFSGIIVIASSLPRGLQAKQTELTTAFANQLGVALENASLFERLRKSEEQYVELFETSPDMTHIVTADGTIISCNQTEARTLGYTKEELLGASLLKLYPPEYHDRVRNNLEKVFRGEKQLWGEEEKMVTKDGTILDVSVNAQLIFDDHGKPTLMRAVARDITEKKKLEAKIIHAQRIDSIGNLAGGIAHDFNNILTSILGSTAIMLRRLKRQKENLRFIEIIDTAAKRGASLTRQLLTFARKGTVHVRPILVTNVIKETLLLFERSIDKSITITTNFASQPLIIKGDDGQIQQALLNILINARDAMPTGGTITITTGILVLHEGNLTAPEQRPGKFVTISISDTGVGISPDTLHRIFEPFFTTKDQGKGTGLGLSVVYGVVNAHDGFITVHSTPGKGSEFILHFPLYEAEGLKLSLHRVEKIPRGTEHILVVDDEKEVLEVVSGMLRELGYSTTTVTSGHKAISLIRNNKTFDAVILDLNMPRLSGQTTCLRIKKLNPSQRIIIATGYSNRAIDTSPIRDSVEGFLQKPFQLEELAKTVRSVLDASQR